MIVHIHRTRMAMSGTFYTYEGYVRASEAPQVNPYDTTTVSFGGSRGDFYPYHVARLPALHWQRERGLDRYDAYKAHQALAETELLRLAQSVYPELAGVTVWPHLWIGLPIDEEHDVRTVTV